ncbi:MAG: ATP-grasp domain-containing protein, partial [Verrucomicrobiota bacterium]|nr:ATP-grasp domain-containing protein [Verrucomicrobiota bacterium]
MNLHEYQAKQLLAQYGVEVPGGQPCTTANEARSIAEKLFSEGHEMVVVKIQIHSGGRGKGIFKDGFKGGVHLCKSADDVFEKAKSMLGNTIVTKQTGETGRQVNTLLVASAEKILSEFYLAVLLDRESSQPIIMVSSEGGVDIEEVAETNPNAIIKLQVDPLLGLQAYQARNLAKALGLSGKMIQSAAKLITGIYKTWWECDASMVEINPLCVVENPDGTTKMAAVDAKISIDGNALYRHKKISEMRDLNEEAELEVEASKFDLNYIKLDGNVACLVN